MSRIDTFVNRYCIHFLDVARSHVVNCLDRSLDPKASLFYAELVGRGYDPNAHIDVLPRHRLLYVCIPKCASTTIKMVLSALSGRSPASFDEVHKRRYSGLKSPYQVGPSSLHRLVLDAATLRFSFVRNPYDRLVSAWADKYQNKPLVPGDSFVDKYLKCRQSIDAALPEGHGKTLSFPEFVRFAAATADQRLDAHWQLQDDILNMPGIALDFVGKVESFHGDFARVIAHVGAPPLGDELSRHMNRSPHQPWPDYYSSALAEQVYRAYERDFDRLRYTRAIISPGGSMAAGGGRHRRNGAFKTRLDQAVIDVSRTGLTL